MSKLAERVRMLEERLDKVERLSGPQANRRIEAARVAGKRSAEVRKAKHGSAQPKARTATERPAPTPTPNAPNEDHAELARTCRTLLDDPTQVYRLNPAVLPAVQRVTKAWTAPFGVAFVRLGDSPERDADLRAILEALAAGYMVPELERAGEIATNDPAILAEDSPGPSSFTADVLARLIGAPVSA